MELPQLILLLLPATKASGCHRPLLRWLKTVRPCTAKVITSCSELCAICGRLVVIAARIKLCCECTAKRVCELAVKTAKNDGKERGALFCWLGGIHESAVGFFAASGSLNRERVNPDM